MNKKRLSVVMAGAMLATSVAPVLAAEVTKDETTHGKMGLFIDKLEALMDTKKFHATDAEAGKSVYRFAVIDNATGKDATDVALTGAKTYYTNAEGTKSIKVYSNPYLLKELNANKEYTIKVYELGSYEKDGEYFSVKPATSKADKWGTDFTSLVTAVEAYNTNAETNKDDAISTLRASYAGLAGALKEEWVTKLELNEDKTNLVITLGSQDANGEFNKITINKDSEKVKFAYPVDAKGNVMADASNFDGTNPTSITYKNNLTKNDVQGLIAGFKKDASPVDSDDTEAIAGIESKLLHEVKVLNGDMNYTVKVDDLYDGFMLTEKGHELLNAIRKYEYDDNTKTTQEVDLTISGKGTERTFNVTFTDTANNTKTIVKVVGDSLHLDRITTLKTWLTNKKADVELLAGDNRYATAVEIAKTYIAGNSQYVDKGNVYDKNQNLVLINGKALVDGLAAAPYAKKEGAPILLTAKDSLPKETKAFMKELIGNTTVGNLKSVTVTIIGGEAVVSQSVVDELKDMGVKVKRIAGDNREETSLAIADKIGTTSNAFVVGAEGEADAMSIAAHAAKIEAPIIVSKSAKGLSTVGLNEVSEYTNIEIVGGEGVVPASTETELKELVDNKDNVTRINGKNRFETNALVIKKHHNGFQDALIAKDGQRNKEELVDALPAAIFASSNAATNPSAPIVLATDKISEEQLNQLVLNAKKGSGRTVYQIGHGVAEKVMQTVVTKLGLNK